MLQGEEEIVGLSGAGLKIAWRNQRGRTFKDALLVHVIHAITKVIHQTHITFINVHIVRRTRMAVRGLLPH